MSLNISFFLVCLLPLTLINHTTHAQNAPQDYVNAHNTARSAVGVGPIAWNTTTATYAQNYANSHISDCSLVNSGGTFGENLAKGSGSFSGTNAVGLWVAEKPRYNSASNTCQSGYECKHYTQVVWANSVGLGCARVQCTNGWYWVICSYHSAGNIVGQSPY